MLRKDFYYNYLVVLVNELLMELNLEVILTFVLLETQQQQNHSSLNTFVSFYLEQYILLVRVQLLLV